MVGESPNVEFLQFKTTAQQFVTAEAEKQAEIDCLAFLNGINRIAGVVTRGFIAEIHGIKDAELREPIAAFLDLHAIEHASFLHPHPPLQDGIPGSLLPFE